MCSVGRNAARFRRGFTLAEILVCVIILGIASSVIVPQISQRDDLKVTAAAREVMADIIYAQNLAIVTQRTQYVRFQIDAKQYSVLNSVSPQTIATHPVTKSPYTVVFSSSTMPGLRDTSLISAVFTTSNSTSQAILGFDALGTPLAVAPDGSYSALTGGTIVVKCGNYPLTITIEPYTGELQVN